MSDTRLYAVDSHGEATTPSPPPPPNTPARSGRSTPKARPIYAVPTDRLKFDTQVEALRVIASASRGGTENITAERMGGLMNLSPATAPLNNAFFASVRLIEKVGKGAYKPSEMALKFQQKWTFDREAAPAILAPAFAETWFFEAVKQKLQIGPTTIEQMVETLASIAQTDNSYATQYGFLLEWLKFVGLISLDGGMVTLTVAGSEQMGTGDSPEATTSDKPAKVADSEPVIPPRPPTLDLGPAVVSLSFEVTLRAVDLQKLSAEQITSLFDGVGKVAVIKAALNA